MIEIFRLSGAVTSAHPERAANLWGGGEERGIGQLVLNRVITSNPWDEPVHPLRHKRSLRSRKLCDVHLACAQQLMRDRRRMASSRGHANANADRLDTRHPRQVDTKRP